MTQIATADKPKKKDPNLSKRHARQQSRRTGRAERRATKRLGKRGFDPSQSGYADQHAALTDTILNRINTRKFAGDQEQYGPSGVPGGGGMTNPNPGGKFGGGGGPTVAPAPPMNFDPINVPQPVPGGGGPTIAPVPPIHMPTTPIGLQPPGGGNPVMGPTGPGSKHPDDPNQYSEMPGGGIAGTQIGWQPGGFPGGIAGLLKMLQNFG